MLWDFEKVYNLVETQVPHLRSKDRSGVMLAVPYTTSLPPTDLPIVALIPCIASLVDGLWPTVQKTLGKRLGLGYVIVLV